MINNSLELNLKIRKIISSKPVLVEMILEQEQVLVLSVCSPEKYVVHSPVTAETEELGFVSVCPRSVVPVWRELVDLQKQCFQGPPAIEPNSQMAGELELMSFQC